MKHDLNAHGCGCLMLLIMVALSIYAILHIAGVAR